MKAQAGTASDKHLIVMLVFCNCLGCKLTRKHIFLNPIHQHWVYEQDPRPVPVKYAEDDVVYTRDDCI